MRELDFNGVFKYNVNTEDLSLVTDQIDLPNGIALSPDEKTLYVNKMAFIDGSRKIFKINLESMEMTTHLMVQSYRRKMKEILMG